MKTPAIESMNTREREVFVQMLATVVLRRVLADIERENDGEEHRTGEGATDGAGASPAAV